MAKMFSSLAVGTWPLGTVKQRFGPRKNLKTGQPVKIDMFIVHHAAMTRNLKGEFVDPTRELSANYGMSQNGDIYRVLDESLRPFTSSTWLADTRAVTIEIENELGAPTWKISDRAFDQLARLIADVATRHEFPIDREHVIGHKEVLPRFGKGIATVCPGPWLFSRMDQLCALARKYQAEASKPSKPTPPAKSPEQIEEEELMSAKSEILAAINQSLEVIRRESRPRLYERKSTGELLLVRYETGFQRGPWRDEKTMRASLPVDAEHLVSDQEYKRRLKVSDEDWSQLLGG